MPRQPTGGADQRFASQLASGGGDLLGPFEMDAVGTGGPRRRGGTVQQERQSLAPGQRAGRRCVGLADDQPPDRAGGEHGLDIGCSGRGEQQQPGPSLRRVEPRAVVLGGRRPASPLAFSAHA
jgi:hypothetical protein